SKPAFKAIEISPAETQSIPIPYSFAILYIARQENDLDANNGNVFSYFSSIFVLSVLNCCLICPSLITYNGVPYFSTKSVALISSIYKLLFFICANFVCNTILSPLI